MDKKLKELEMIAPPINPTSGIVKTGSLNSQEAGRIYGKFTPSPIGHIKVQKIDGSIFDQPLARRERRLLKRRMRNG